WFAWSLEQAPGRNHRLLHFWPLVARIVELGAHLNDVESLATAGLQKVSDLGGRAGAAVEPKIEMLRLNDHRHARVQSRDGAAGGSGEDRDRVDLTAVGAEPFLVDRRQTDGPAPSRPHVMRALGTRSARPFIIAVGGDEAALVAQRGAERG